MTHTRSTTPAADLRFATHEILDPVLPPVGTPTGRISNRRWFFAVGPARGAPKPPQRPVGLLSHSLRYTEPRIGIGRHDSTAGTCSAWRCALHCGMRIRHKGLRALHERDNPARLPAGLVPRLKRILFRLQEATHPRSAEAPGFRLHPLKGDRAGQWSVRVSGNWRVVFRFEDGEAVDVDLIDYH